MAIGLGDIYEKLKELITITDKVRENTERIAKPEEKADTIQYRLAEMRGDIKVILTRLDMKDEISAIKIQLAEHIAECEKAKA